MNAAMVDQLFADFLPRLVHQRIITDEIVGVLIGQLNEEIEKWPSRPGRSTNAPKRRFGDKRCGVWLDRARPSGSHDAVPWLLSRRARCAGRTVFPWPDSRGPIPVARRSTPLPRHLIDHKQTHPAPRPPRRRSFPFPSPASITNGVTVASQHGIDQASPEGATAPLPAARAAG